MDSTITDEQLKALADDFAIRGIEPEFAEERDVASALSELLAAREALKAAWAYIDGLQLRAPTPPTVNSGDKTR